MVNPSKSSNSAEAGNATTEFVMVIGLVVLLFAGVLQVAFVLYTRNMMVDAAASGARYGTLLDRSYEDGAVRTRQLLDDNLPVGGTTEVSYQVVNHSGVQMLEMRVNAPLPIIGPFGVPHTLTVSGHAALQR